MTARTSAGAGLVEIAVALLVLSVSVLGLARGQLLARQASAEAIQRGEAVRMASGLVEMLQAGGVDPAAYRFRDLNEIAPPTGDCRTRSCDSAQWAAWNLWQWRGELEGAAAHDRQGHRVAGLLAPGACLRMAGEMAVLALVWRNSPAGGTPGCGDTAPAASGARLLISARPPGQAL